MGVISRSAGYQRGHTVRLYSEKQLDYLQRDLQAHIMQSEYSKTKKTQGKKKKKKRKNWYFCEAEVNWPTLPPETAPGETIQARSVYQ